MIEREGCEAVVPGLIEFFLFGIAGGIFQKDPLGRSAKGALGGKIGLSAIAKFRKPVNDALAASTRFNPPANIYELAEYASEIFEPVQLDGRGLAAHRRNGGAHCVGRAERSVHAAVRMPAEPRGGQSCDQGAAPPLPRKQHRGRRLRPGRV